MVEMENIIEALTHAEYLLFEIDGYQEEFAKVGDVLNKLTGDLALIREHEMMEEH